MTEAREYEGAIEMVTDMGGTWSAPRVLLPRVTNENHYYPTFSPDGSFLVYDQSNCSGSLSIACNAYQDPTAQLKALALDLPGAQPLALARANAPGVMDVGRTDLTNSFPKWSPFIFQRTSELGSKVEWITFSSTRNYGLRAAPTGGGDENPQGTLIWMAAVDPTRVAQGTDPSYPAFALPFQDTATSNHIAQWTTRIVPPVGLRLP
jgi:hypothetical protein